MKTQKLKVSLNEIKRMKELAGIVPLNELSPKTRDSAASKAFSKSHDSKSGVERRIASRQFDKFKEVPQQYQKKAKEIVDIISNDIFNSEIVSEVQYALKKDITDIYNKGVHFKVVVRLKDGKSYMYVDASVNRDGEINMEYDKNAVRDFRPTPQLDAKISSLLKSLKKEVAYD